MGPFFKLAQGPWPPKEGCYASILCFKINLLWERATEIIKGGERFYEKTNIVYQKLIKNIN